MAATEESLQSLRIGDTVLLYAAEAKGYVFSELARWVVVDCYKIGSTCSYFPHRICFDLANWCLSFWSSEHNSAALYRVDSEEDPNLPNVHCEYIGSTCMLQFALPQAMYDESNFVTAVATFKIVAANKYKSQERLNEIKQHLK